MRYQNPQLLYFLFAIAIPILIHLFNFRKHKTIYFSSIRFLKEIKEDNRKKSNLKNILILISRILAISFLVLAFTRPYIPSTTQQKTKNIFMYIDNSFSMDGDAGSGRLLNIAKEKARIVSKSYPNGSNFYIITNDFESKHNNSFNAATIGQQIDNIQSSSIGKSLNEIINRQQTIGVDNSHLYIISDMQRSTILLDKINQIDSSITLLFIPIIAQQQSNLSIDSCWINSPIITAESQIKLFVNLSNNSEVDVQDEVVYLNINGKPKSQQFVNLKASQQKNIDFNFTTALKRNIIGEITINDSPIAFDNKLYFSIKRNKKINILCVNQESENKSLNTLFMQDTTLFNYENVGLSSIDYNSIVKQELVILNQIQELSSGLLSTLKKVLTIGGSIIVLPPRNIDIKKYNQMLKQLGLNTITSINDTKLEISNINIEHSLFNTVFEGKLNKINYPTANHYFITTNSITNTTILSLENNKSFLSVYNNGKGLIYKFNGPLDNDCTNFTKHALFVPTLLNIATQSVRASNLYNTIGTNDYFISSYKNNEKELLHLKNTKVDIIPTAKASGSKTYYYTHNQIKENGIYNLVNSSETIEFIAFNYSRDESIVEPLNLKEIKDWIAKNNLANIHIMSSKLKNLKHEIHQQQNGKEFWELALILSLLFFAFEILLIKLIKS
ncbi:BatA domain-containing protein [Flavobacteriales bacterium]|nr:BatA domain-containing protein [Flavobacteriales bacterium]